MADDWAVDVRKYAPQADRKVFVGIVRHCGIAFQNKPSSLISLSTQEDVARLRETFLKKNSLTCRRIALQSAPRSAERILPVGH